MGESMDGLKERVDKWQKNAEKIRLSASVRREGVDSKIRIKVDSPEEYRVSSNELASDIVNKAIQFAFEFAAKESVSFEEAGYVRQTVYSDICSLVNYLFSNGFDAYESVLERYCALARMQYRLSNITFQKGEWIRDDGTVVTETVAKLMDGSCAF